MCAKPVLRKKLLGNSGIFQKLPETVVGLSQISVSHIYLQCCSLSQYSMIQKFQVPGPTPSQHYVWYLWQHPFLSPPVLALPETRQGTTCFSPPPVPGGRARAQGQTCHLSTKEAILTSQGRLELGWNWPTMGAREETTVPSPLDSGIP